MSLNANLRWKRARLGLSLTAWAVVLLIALANVGARRAVRSSETAITNHVVASTPTQRRIADFESELITITPHGFEPQEITRPEGRVLLMVDNRSDLDMTSLRLTRETSARINEIRVPREEPNWSEPLDLQPGRYILTESEHPDWQCRFIITPR
jgi:hypothetical protein